MANKKNRKGIVLPNDFGGSDFTEENTILNYKPSIVYEEPPQEDEGEGAAPGESSDTTNQIEEFRKKTEGIIKGYEAIDKLADLTQKRVDAKVKDSGGLKICLDPVIDALTIAALKRQFPDSDGKCITYEIYREALDRLNKYNKKAPVVEDKDIEAAQKDPLKVDFGGLGNLPGQNRVELSSLASTIQPIDTNSFQDSAVKSLFKMMLPLIMGVITAAVLQHMLAAPHKPF